MDVRKEVLAAEKRIKKYIRETPLEFSPYLSDLCKCNVFLKLENLQLTGSFKIRGAFNKLLSLSKKQKENGVITASTGNHALGVAYALKKLGYKGTIYLPTNASKAKIEALSYYDVPLKYHSTDCVETEVFARKVAEENNLVFVSPYNDPQIIGGQGTIAAELVRQLEKIDYVLVPIGGGGLISGIAGFLKIKDKNIKIIGCMPKNSPVMSESIKADKIINMKTKPTLSDGTAGGIEPDAITFDICKKYVDDYILVTENEIKKAIKLVLEKHHLVIEGSAGVTVASFLKERRRFKGKNIVLIICGQNISMDKLKQILCE